MKSVSRAALVLSVALGCVGCDQASKLLAGQSLAGRGPLSYLGGTLRLQYAENPGAFLSLGAGMPEGWRYGLFTLLVGIFLAGLLVYLLRANGSGWPATVALSLVLGGGVGNLIDRIAHQGRVIDFLNMGIGSLRTGVFNIADLAITCGALCYALLLCRRTKSSQS